MKPLVHRFLLASLFLCAVVVAGFALQEGSGICLPEHHAAEEQGALYCNCIAMGGYQLCGKDGKPFSYQEWLNENNRRDGDVDPKTKKPKQKPVPKCKMSCKEDHCECCHYMNKFKGKRRAEIMRSYDPV